LGVEGRQIWIKSAFSDGPKIAIQDNPSFSRVVEKSVHPSIPNFGHFNAP
jgi:hypothetical protein